MRKILVSAYGCEPFRGSEAGVGWNWILQMAKYNELFVIARKNDENKIVANLPEEYCDHLHFYYYDTNPIFMRLKRRDKGLYLYYTFWQIGIIPMVKKLIYDVKPDYTMHLTFGSLRMPTFLPFFDVPFIWGPLGGGDGIPKSFLKKMPVKQRIIQSLRYLLIATSFMNPLVTIPSKKASLILCRTNNNKEAIPRKYRNKAKVILETGMGDDVFSYNKIAQDKSSDKVEFIITGRLVPFKNVALAVEAFGKAQKIAKDIHLTIIGSESEKENILNSVTNLSLQEAVEVIDERPRSEVLECLQYSDVYLFPSLREGGSWALMEAMAVGLPVICLKWTGMEIITDDLGAIRIGPTDYDTVCNDFSKAIIKLASNKNLRREMGISNRERIRNHFTWEAKADFMEELLEDLGQ